MQHIRQLQLALSILLVALLLLIVCGAVLILNYEPDAQVVASKGNGQTPTPDNAGTPTVAVAQLSEAAKLGEGLFNNNGCNACHSTGTDVLVGPGLKGISQRRPEPWLVDWIHNSQKVIESGDKYGVDLYNKFNKTPMPSYTNLSPEDIKNIIAYVEGK